MTDYRFDDFDTQVQCEEVYIEEDIQRWWYGEVSTDEGEPFA